MMSVEACIANRVHSPLKLRILTAYSYNLKFGLIQLITHPLSINHFAFNIFSASPILGRDFAVRDISTKNRAGLLAIEIRLLMAFLLSSFK